MNLLFVYKMNVVLKVKITPKSLMCVTHILYTQQVTPKAMSYTYPWNYRDYRGDFKFYYNNLHNIRKEILYQMSVVYQPPNVHLQCGGLTIYVDAAAPGSACNFTFSHTHGLGSGIRALEAFSHGIMHLAATFELDCQYVAFMKDASWRDVIFSKQSTDSSCLEFPFRFHKQDYMLPPLTKEHFHRDSVRQLQEHDTNVADHVHFLGIPFANLRVFLDNALPIIFSVSDALGICFDSATNAATNELMPFVLGGFSEPKLEDPENDLMSPFLFFAQPTLGLRSAALTILSATDVAEFPSSPYLTDLKIKQENWNEKYIANYVLRPSDLQAIGEAVPEPFIRAHLQRFTQEVARDSLKGLGVYASNLKIAVIRGLRHAAAAGSSSAPEPDEVHDLLWDQRLRRRGAHSDPATLLMGDVIRFLGEPKRRERKIQYRSGW